MLACSPASCALNLSWFRPAVPGAKRQHFPKIRVVPLNDAKHIALRLEVDTGHPWLMFGCGWVVASALTKKKQTHLKTSWQALQACTRITRCDE